jgi:putative ABC transport system permease protein
MFKNYFIVAWRNIIKNRFYSIVNIVGLSIGIAFSFLIGAFVWNELQINKDLKNAENQYIIQSKWKDPNMGIGLTTLGPLAKRLRESYPDLVANYYRFDGISTNVSSGDKHFREGLQVGDSTLLSMYGFPLIDGNAKTALNDPYSVVITDEKAIKYFGKTNVVGQTLNVESVKGTKRDFKITAVLKTPHENSVTFITSSNDGFYFPEIDSSFFGRNMEAWQNIYIVEYIELQKGVSPKDLEKPMEQLIKLEAPKMISENIHPYLVSLKDYYLSSNGGVAKKMIYTLSSIVLFILLMAIINFVNISISRSAARMKEIGIRKVLGGLRKQLILQFLIESTILVFLATIFALILYFLAKNYFSAVLGKQIPGIFSFPVYFIIIPFALTFLIGMLAGSYPAFVLSSLRSIDSLKGKLGSVKENILLRRSLIAFQFCTACISFIGAIIISQQVSYFFSKDLGYDKDYIVSAQVPRDWSLKGVQRMETMRREFASLPQVKDVTLSYEIPNGNNGDNAMIWKSGQDQTQTINAIILKTDKDYAATFGIPLITGNFFDEANDSLKIVINESASKAFGWQDPHEAISKQVRINGFALPLTIVGVTKDFHFTSMQGKIEPLAFFNVNLTLQYRFLSFKIRPGNIGNTVAALQKKWSQIFPTAAFEYTFMDDTLKGLYQTELQLKQASYIATVLSMIIILLGVLGLISLSIQKRTKEIGIRKILGSPVSSIINLFLKDFLVVIIIAAVFACPLAYYIMQNWLSDYAYRINITAEPFIFSVVILGLITSILIIIQTIKAAVADPVKSLRSE